MADNVTFQPTVATPPSGTVVSSDDAGVAGQVQRMKLAQSADGSADHIPADADGLLVNLGANNDVTLAGTVTVDGSAVTQPISNAALTELAAAIDTEVQVDVVGALPAGTNNIGDVDVASIAAGDNNIGNVDIVTMPNVTINEPVSVDDNGGSLTVDAAGDVAHDAVDSGNPVKIGGKAESTSPTAVADGDRVDAWFTLSGQQVVALASGNNIADVLSGSVNTLAIALHDGTSNSFASNTAPGDTEDNTYVGVGLESISRGMVFNGTTWNRQRGDLLGLHVSRQATAATATLTNVSDTATSTTLLAANTSRKGASIHNDSTAVLYVKFGTTASATSFTVKMAADAHYEVPFGFTGRIDGIWASDASGAARITELT